MLKDAFIRYQSSEEGNAEDPQYPIEVIDTLETLLKEAEALLKPGSVEMKRFKLAADFWTEPFRQQRAKATYIPPVYRVPHLADGDRPVLDGTPDEPFWAKAPVMPLINKFSGTPVPGIADVRLAWDGKGVYLAFKSRAGAPKTDSSLSLNDSFEVFFSQGLGKEMFNQILFDATGAEEFLRQRLLPIPQPKDMQWNAPGHVYRARTTPYGWSAELFVPFSAFEDGVVPKPGEDWNFNFVITYRNAKPHETASYSLTGAANKNLSMFGIIRFLDHGK